MKNRSYKTSSYVSEYISFPLVHFSCEETFITQLSKVIRRLMLGGYVQYVNIFLKYQTTLQFS